MVESRGRRYGIDFSTERVRLIGRVAANGQQCLDVMTDSYPDRFDQEIFDADAEYYFSIAEDEAIIKRIEIPAVDDVDVNEQARFEMACTLLDRPEQYHLNVYPTGIDNVYLTVAINRKLVTERQDYLKAKIPRPAGFNLRSLAMARAYLTFCEPAVKGLICLLDLDINRASFCLLNNDCPIMIGCIGGNHNGAAPTAAKKTITASFLSDIAAVLKFQLTSLMRVMPKVTLSRIVLTGYLSTGDDIGAVLEEKAVVPVVQPVLNRHLFVESTSSEGSRYLVPLGLTIGD